MIQYKEKKQNNKEKRKYLRYSNRRSKTLVSLESQEEETEYSTQNIFEDIMAKIFSNLAKDINLPIQIPEQTLKE